MKILLVHNRYQIAGGEEVVFEHERQMLERMGNQVLTYCRSNFEADVYTGLSRLSLIKNIAWSDETQRQLGKILRDEKPDIVHVHNTFMMMSPAVFATCREANIPVVQTLHNYRLFCPAANFIRDGKVCEECKDHTLWRGIQHGCFRDSRSATASVALMISTQRQRKAYPDAFIALSEFARQKFLSGGIPAERVFVKPNFAYPDPGARATDGDFAIFVGRISAEKGLHTLLAAWKQMERRIPLSIIGDGPLLEELSDKASAMKLEEVTFHGRMSHAETTQAIKASRLLLAPSECYENFPMTIVEAFACGVPVIGTSLGSTQEIVQDGHVGLQFAVSSPADLAAKVEWAWSHPQEMWQMGRNARREFETRYTAEKNYPQLMEIYQRAAAIEAVATPAAVEEKLTLSRG